MKKNIISILKSNNTEDIQIPVFFDNTIVDLGVMVGFDGEINQIEQKCNFTYKGNNMVVQVYNTVNTNKLPTLIDSIFIVSWGDGSSNSILPSLKVGETNLPYVTHTYANSGTYTIKLTVDSPWEVQEVEKQIDIPYVNTFGYPEKLGRLTFKIPYIEPTEYITQQYIEDYRTTTGLTESSMISFLGIGKSRIDELREYGDNPDFSNVFIMTINNEIVTGYTIDGLYYIDYPEGFTQITGKTYLNSDFFHDEVYNGMVTRNEHFLGFVEEPIIYSDILIERGKMSVMEKNLRLCELDSTGELDVYGNGYFNVRKQ